MANISRIDVRIRTADVNGAGTDGDVYLGIGGREFGIDSSDNDFERGSDRVYTLGSGASVLNSHLNDPRNPQLDTGDLDPFPVYIRAEMLAVPTSDWLVELISVAVNPGPGEIRYGSLVGADRKIWLGHKKGKFVLLRRI